MSPALLTGSVEGQYQQRNSTDKHLLFGSTCLLMIALTISRSPQEHSRERGVSPAQFTATVDIQANQWRNQDLGRAGLKLFEQGQSLTP